MAVRPASPRPNRLLEIAAGLALAALAAGALLLSPAGVPEIPGAPPPAATPPERAGPTRPDCALLRSPRDGHVRRTLAELRTSVEAMRRLAGQPPREIAPDDPADALCAEEGD